MYEPKYTNRRTVLRTLGGGVLASVALSGPALAHDPKQNGQIPVFLTWGDDEIWEMVDAEPPSRDRMQDAEGNDHAHEPVYLISHVDQEHNAHFPPFDQVVPIPSAGEKFSAQWHPKLVLDGGDPATTDQNGTRLTSASTIESATNVTISALPEETVFTCPVRPHQDRGSSNGNGGGRSKQ